MPRYNKKMFQDYQGMASIFTAIDEKMKALGEGRDIVRFHIGDTFLKPPPEARPASFDPAVGNDYNLYCNTAGIPSLLSLLRDKLEDENGFKGLETDSIQVTCGATHGLYAAFRTLLAQGEKVMVLAPHWPIINGVIRNAGGIPVDAPLYIRLYEEPGMDIVSHLDSLLEPGTAAIYLNSPNNPCGKVLTAGQIEQIAEFAVKNGLWIVSDEAYEHFIYNGDRHLSIATLDGMFDRTVTVFTFSKTFAAAGYRLGYPVAAPELARTMNKRVVKSLYGVSTLLQYMVRPAMADRSEWIAWLRARYQRQLEIAEESLSCGFHHPEGGFYIFADLGDYLDDGGMLPLINRLLEAGVSVTPGEVFGEGFENYVRICFTGEPEERLKLGIERINNVLGERSRN